MRLMHRNIFQLSLSLLLLNSFPDYNVVLVKICDSYMYKFLLFSNITQPYFGYQIFFFKYYDNTETSCKTHVF